jgi:hypothetical protein
MLKSAFTPLAQNLNNLTGHNPSVTDPLQPLHFGGNASAVARLWRTGKAKSKSKAKGAARQDSQEEQDFSAGTKHNSDKETAFLTGGRPRERRGKHLADKFFWIG